MRLFCWQCHRITLHLVNISHTDNNKQYRFDQFFHRQLSTSFSRQLYATYSTGYPSNADTIKWRQARQTWWIITATAASSNSTACLILMTIGSRVAKLEKEHMGRCTRPQTNIQVGVNAYYVCSWCLTVWNAGSIIVMVVLSDTGDRSTAANEK